MHSLITTTAKIQSIRIRNECMAQQQVRAAVTAFSSNWKTRLQHNAMTAKGRLKPVATG